MARDNLKIQTFKKHSKINYPRIIFINEIIS